jgi:hypothetical protein
MTTRISLAVAYVRFGIGCLSEFRTAMEAANRTAYTTQWVLVVSLRLIPARAKTLQSK